MNCLICRTEFTNVEIIRDHYILEYLVDATNDVFRELFAPDIAEKSCHICGLQFDTCRMKKITCFYYTIIRLVEVGYSSIQLISFNIEKVVPDNDYNIYGYAEIINPQNDGDIGINNARAWITNVFTGRYYSNYIKGEIKRGILKRLIINGEFGRSWTFKMFKELI